MSTKQERLKALREAYFNAFVSSVMPRVPGAAILDFARKRPELHELLCELKPEDFDDVRGDELCSDRREFKIWRVY